MMNKRVSKTERLDHKDVQDDDGNGDSNIFVPSLLLIETVPVQA